MTLTREELTQRIQPWLEPISAATPSGSSARYEPDYERILVEVGKLEAPTGGTVDWLQVATLGKKLLGTKSKDMLLAAYTGFALFAPKKSLSGLLEGMVLVSELTDRFWDSLFPDSKRQKARANAVGWFVQRVSLSIGDLVPAAGDRDVVEALVPAAQRLSDVCRTRLTEGGPAFGPLMEALERLRLQLPPEAPPPPPPAPEPGPSASTGSTSGSAPTAAAASVAAPAMPTRGADATAWLREVGAALCQAAADVRRAGPADPVSYRLLRTGIWLHLSQPPPRGSNGRCPFAGLPADLRAQLQALATNAKWVELLEEAESALIQHRFQLDLHRFSAAALAGLGHTGARAALVAELGAWLRRVPEAVELSASDGSPVADAQTRAWLDLEVRGGGGTAPGAGSGTDSTAESVGEAKSLFATGKGAEALALLQGRVQTADSGRARFRLRLELAKLCAPNQPAVARALYAALARECTAHDLDTWEPALTAECLEGLLSSRASGALSEEDAGYFQRLCRISPSAAARVQT
ncbi:MAG TPA: type VI secretion system protein TssA [Myxococcaceae bacterium]